MTDTGNVTLTELEHLDLAAEVAGMQPIEVLLPRHRTVATGGLRFHLVEWGNPDKPTILFLHGVGLTARTWDLVCLGLRQDFHCLALDQRGHGDTEWSTDGDYGTEALCADLRGLVQHLGVDDFFLVGHSMGGMVALSYAEADVARLRALVLVDSAPGERNPAPSPSTAQQQPNRVFDFMAGPSELDSVEDFVDRAMAFNPSRDPRLLRRSLLHNLRQLPDGRWTWKYDRARILGRDRSKMAASRRALWDALDAVTCPTLLLRGQRSESLSDATAAEFTAALPDGRWEVIPDAGHTIQGDNPRGLLAALSPFLNEVLLASV